MPPSGNRSVDVHAKRANFTVPASLLARADEVIE
jgi:hypothetical protein